MWVLALLFASIASAQAQASSDETPEAGESWVPGAFVEAGFVPGLHISFVTADDLAADKLKELCEKAGTLRGGTPINCEGVRDQTLDAVRINAGLRLGPIELRTGFTGSTGGRLDYLDIDLGAGFRIALSRWLTTDIELAYVMRQGDLASDGARAGLGLSVRATQGLSFQVRGTFDVTGVPAELSDAKMAFLSYGTALVFGTRIEFGG